MYCKYCKKTDHQIDKCNEIICRTCKEIGHPYWQCKKKYNVNRSTMINPVKNVEEKKEDIINIKRNINYYTDFIGKQWALMVE